MTEENYWYSSLEPALEAKATAEARIIVDAFRDREISIEIGGVRDHAEEDHDLHPGGIAYMYATDHILTRAQYLGGLGGIHESQPIRDARVRRGVLDVLETHGVGRVAVRPVIGDIVLVHLNPEREKGASGGNGESHGGNDETPGGEGGTAGGDQPDVLELLERIDDEVGVGIATPDHVMTAASHMTPCSATEPQQVFPTAGPYPAACRDGGARVRIFQADTGLVAGAAETFPWLAGVYGDPDPRAGTGPASTISPYGGHGTFVAGVMRCMAPQAQVHVENIFGTGGSALESEVAKRLNAAFGFGFGIVHITASCHTRKNVPPVALEAWLERLRSYKGVLCVAEAGNNKTQRPAWPGAFPDVLSVGALAFDWRRRADFSNYGGWVDVYAPGENLINAIGSGTYTCQIPPDVGQVRTFSGLAQWSGTSFSAPIVTGMIAARMARCGESAREAAAALLAKARAQTIPGVGPVLFPCCDDDDDDEHCDGCDGGRCGRGCSCGSCGSDCGGCGDDCGCGGGHRRRRPMPRAERQAEITDRGSPYGFRFRGDFWPRRLPG
ncbi:MAG TPA: S8/S53 family peptidase, partial [Streptosporangiaceae bacterium]|nr:S8/S53 family peptidase [Streptosporangiaceae bacterium]